MKNRNPSLFIYFFNFVDSKATLLWNTFEVIDLIHVSPYTHMHEYSQEHTNKHTLTLAR